jgi:hypothetical protein
VLLHVGAGLRFGDEVQDERVFRPRGRGHGLNEDREFGWSVRSTLIAI